MTYNLLVLPGCATHFACNWPLSALSMISMATKFKRTNTPNLDLAIEYGTYYGRVKVGGKLIRECLGKTKRAAEEKLVVNGWLVQARIQLVEVVLARGKLISEQVCECHNARRGVARKRARDFGSSIAASQQSVPNA